MGTFHVFKIVQMVPNRTKHHILPIPYQSSALFRCITALCSKCCRILENTEIMQEHWYEIIICIIACFILICKAIVVLNFYCICYHFLCPCQNIWKIERRGMFERNNHWLCTLSAAIIVHHNSIIVRNISLDTRRKLNVRKTSYDVQGVFWTSSIR